ncbi:MAG: hypothetical protein ACRCZP_05400 [Phycicoccus sp.]
MPFEPVGDRARWRVLVDLFKATARGTMVDYVELGDALGLHPDNDRDAIRAAVQAASKHLSAEHNRSLQAVRGFGYRVVLPEEHIDLARGQQRRSRKALARAQVHVTHVDLSALDEVQRSMVMAAASALAWQQQQIKRLDLRQSDLEQVVASVVETKASVEQVAELEQRIADLEAERKTK